MRILHHSFVLYRIPFSAPCSLYDAQALTGRRLTIVAKLLLKKFATFLRIDGERCYRSRFQAG